MREGRITIANESGLGRDTTVELNGMDISTVLRGITLRIDADGPPEVFLELAELDGLSVHVRAAVAAYIDPEPSEAGEEEG